MKNNKINFVFFGTPRYAVLLLEELKEKQLMPSLVVTAPDRRQGRGMQLKPSPVKVWAEKNGAAVLQPEKLDADFISDLQPTNHNIQKWDVFAIAAYGKIIPQAILDIPEHKTLNVHPSLLPKYRGPSPIETQILKDDQLLGVSVIKADSEMDHGPLLAQTQIHPEKWPMGAQELEDILWTEGGRLLAHLLPKWVRGEVEEVPQEHDNAIYTPFIKKTDAQIDLSNDSYQNLLKIKAYEVWPRAYFFDQNGKRVVVTEADWQNNQLEIHKVIPEGKKEIDYSVFKNS